MSAAPRVKTEDFFSGTHGYARLSLSLETNTGLPELDIERRAEQPLHKLQSYLTHAKNRTLIVAESLGRRETMLQLFTENHVNIKTCENWADFQAATEHYYERHNFKH